MQNVPSVLLRLMLGTLLTSAGLAPAHANFGAIDALMAKGQSQQALKLAGKGSENDQLYFAALIMMQDGLSADAETIFKQMLAKDGSLELVRLGLIKALIAQNKTVEAAQFAQRSDFKKLDGDTAKKYAALIEVAKSILPKSVKRNGFVVSLNMAPSTNVNGGSTIKTVFIGGVPFKLADDSVQQSGINLNGSVTAFQTMDLTNNLALRLKGGVSSTANIKQFHEAEITASFAGDFLWKTAGWSASLGPVIEHVWHESDPELWRYGAQFSLAKGWKDGSDASFGSRLVAQDYIKNSVKDGYAFNASASYGRLLSPVWRVEVQAGFSMEKTKLDHLSYVAYSGGVEITRKIELNGDLFVSAGVDLKQRDYQGKHPLSSGARHDTTTAVSVSLAHSKINAFGITPKLIYEYTDTQSNIDIYATNAHTVRLAINKSF